MTAAKRQPPCKCERLTFPHRADWKCDAYADHALDGPPDEIAEQQQREWNADRAQDARAINGGGQ